MMINKSLLTIFSAAFFLTVLAGAHAQQTNSQKISNRAINTAVPFLMIAPDSRSGALANTGVATSPDANSAHWNNGKLAFIENQWGASLSYTPWLARLINDMSLSYLSGYYKIDDVQAIGLSMKYFDLGDIDLTDRHGGAIATIRAREFSFDGTYSRKLSEKLGVGITARYIFSNIADYVSASGADASPGTSVAADVGLYYNSNPNYVGSLSNLAFGVHISNIGRKLGYNDRENRDFLPTNLRLGTAYTTHLDPYNTITIAVDFNKLLVPTLPDTANNTSMLSGMFKSFTDAPDGASEEFQEISISTGVEYWYNSLFAARLGYFYEHPDKGSWRYFTIGLGIRYQAFGIDFAYLVPQGEDNPLGETLRFTLLFNFEDGQAVSAN